MILFIIGLGLSAGAAAAEQNSINVPAAQGPINVPAGMHQYPTLDTVTMVIKCMDDIGGQSEETLYTCSCRHDVIASKLSYADYENGSLWLRYKHMPGEKGGVFRDSQVGKKLGKKLEAVRQEAKKTCPVVPHLESPRLQKEHKKMMKKQMDNG